MKFRNFMALTAIFAVLASACTEKEPLDNPKDDNDGDNTEVVDPEQPGEGEGEDEGDQNTPVEKLFNATYDREWTAEAVSVWDGQSANRFKATVTGGSTVLLTGTVAPDAESFYAAYPYSEDASFFALENSVTARFELPKTLAEGVEPEFAFAKVDADGNVAFNSSMAYLQLSLAEDMTDVESLTFSGLGESDYLSGLLDVTISADGTTSEFVEYDRSVSVTYTPSSGSVFSASSVLKFPFYARNFAQGVSLSVKYTGSDEVLTVALEQPRDVAPGQVIALSDTPLNKAWFAPEPDPDPASSYYATYSAGGDITIAGKTYNKATYGEGTLVRSGETVDLTSGNKVYFVEPGAVTKIGPTNSTVKYIVIGDDPAQRTKVTQAASIKVGKDNAHYAFLNLDIDMQITATGSGNDVMTIVNNGSTIERIAFDNCRMEYPMNGRQFIYKGDETTKIKDFAFHNCDYCFEYTTDHIYLLRLDSKAAVHDSFDFQNNLFWHTGTMLDAKGFNIVTGPNSTVGSLKFKNNTFVNLKTQSNASSYFHVGVDATEADIQNNLFYFDTANCNMYLHRKSASSCTCQNNAYYINQTETTFTLKPFTTTPTGATLFTGLESSPFTSMDVATGKFVKSDAYKNYGASR